MGLVGPLKLYVSFAEYRLFYRDIKFYEDKVYIFMGWLQLVGPLQLFFSFAEYRLFYRDILFSEDKVDLLTIVRLFCRISSLLYISFAKET